MSVECKVFVSLLTHKIQAASQLFVGLFAVADLRWNE